MGRANRTNYLNYMIKIVIKENKKLLSEALTRLQAMELLRSKATIKRVIALQIEIDGGTKKDPEYMESLITFFREVVDSSIPVDISDNQKALSIIWVKNFFLNDKNKFYNHVVRNDYNHNENLRNTIERYFQFIRFIDPNFKDINKVANLSDLEELVQNARPKYEAYQNKKSNSDAAGGTEIIYEDDKYTIYLPNNKGASCELGKGTDWCTAAPGVDTHYNRYHTKDDPLFIIFRKPRTASEIEIVNSNNSMHGVLNKYQFHYSSAQFMDEADESIGNSREGIEIIKTIHKILVDNVGKRFPWLKTILVKTDVGISIKQTFKDDESESGLQGIEYQDIFTELKYGGDFPNISIGISGPDSYKDNLGKVYGNPYDVIYYDLKWDQMIVHDKADTSPLKRGEVSRTSNGYKTVDGRNNGPCYLKIFKYINPKTGDLVKIEIDQAKWMFEGMNIARYEDSTGMVFFGRGGDSEYGKELFNKIWSEQFEADYEQNFKGKEEQYATMVLKQYVNE